MTVLYRPVLITSAEQAEALPEGIVVIGTRAGVIDKGSRGRWWAGLTQVPARTVIGGTALMPVELREQTHRLHGRKAEVPWGELIQITYPGAGETDESRDWQCTSYSTPWEEA